MAETPENHQNHGFGPPEQNSAMPVAGGGGGVSGGGVEVQSRPRSAGPTISLIKGGERWNFHWEAGDEATLINRIAEMARDPAVPFDWYDAAVVCKHIAQPFKS